MTNQYNPRKRKTNSKTGRSDKTIQTGAAKGWKPETPFFPLTFNLMASPAFIGLNIPARKIFEFLLKEHMLHGGAENGNLAAPYRQLIDYGISGRDLPKAFKMLNAFGLVRRTDIEPDNQFTAGRRRMARYKLTMIPDKFGNLPSDEWRNIFERDVLAFKEQEINEYQAKQKRKSNNN